jgi:hypothetical protein
MCTPLRNWGCRTGPQGMIQRGIQGGSGRGHVVSSGVDAVGLVFGGTVVSGSADAVRVELSHLTVAARREVTLIVAVTNRTPLSIAGICLKAALGAGLSIITSHSRNTSVASLPAGASHQWVFTAQVVSVAFATISLRVQLPRCAGGGGLGGGVGVGVGREMRCEEYSIPIADLLQPCPKQAAAGHADVQFFMSTWASLAYTISVAASAVGADAAERILRHLENDSSLSRVDYCARRKPAQDLGGQDLEAQERLQETSFHTSAASKTWFGDVVALGITGNYAVEEDLWYFRVEFRSSCAAALSSLARVFRLCVFRARSCIHVCVNWVYYFCMCVCECVSVHV